MGELVNARLTTIVSTAIALLIVGLNIYLLIKVFAKG
jgi:Mn2+/Fe2+ NRAMP family transporter